jgi:hypothetical protein
MNKPTSGVIVREGILHSLKVTVTGGQICVLVANSTIFEVSVRTYTPVRLGAIGVARLFGLIEAPYLAKDQSKVRVAAS